MNPTSAVSVATLQQYFPSRTGAQRRSGLLAIFEKIRPSAALQAGLERAFAKSLVEPGTLPQAEAVAEGRGFCYGRRELEAKFLAPSDLSYMIPMNVELGNSLEGIVGSCQLRRGTRDNEQYNKP
jgi:hypothetical protein